MGDYISTITPAPDSETDLALLITYCVFSGEVGGWGGDRKGGVDDGKTSSMKRDACFCTVNALSSMLLKVDCSQLIWGRKKTNDCHGISCY